MYVSVCVSVYVSVYASVYASVYVSVYASVHVSVYVSVYLSLSIDRSQVHSFAVRHMALNTPADVVISVDIKGVIEYWDAGDYTFPGKTASDPKGKVLFQYKSETDLYDLAKAKTQADCIAVSPDGHSFALTSSDAQVRVFQFLTGTYAAGHHTWWAFVCMHTGIGIGFGIGFNVVL